MEEKKVKEGQFSYEQAQMILGQCWLAEKPIFKEVIYHERNWGYGVERGNFPAKKESGKIRVWENPAGFYVEAI